MEGNEMRKILALFLMLSVTALHFSCAGYRVVRKDIETAPEWDGKKHEILRVLKTSGEYIEFSKINPARVYGSSVVGVKVTKDVALEIEQFDSISKDKADANTYKTEDGLTYHVRKRTKDKIYCDMLETIQIPLSDVSTVWLKEGESFSLLGSSAFLLLFIGGIVVVGVVAMSGMKVF
jgi:hypothetical protein